MSCRDGTIDCRAAGLRDTVAGGRGEASRTVQTGDDLADIWDNSAIVWLLARWHHDDVEDFA